MTCDRSLRAWLGALDPQIEARIEALLLLEEKDWEEEVNKKTCYGLFGMLARALFYAPDCPHSRIGRRMV
jgi:hypothetical protein